MGRGRATRGGGSGNGSGGGANGAGRRPAVTWSDDRLSFSIAQDAARLTERNLDEWIEAAQEAFRSHTPAEGAVPPFCTCADFSHNDLGDGGVEKIVSLLTSWGSPVRILRLSKSRYADAGAAVLATMLTALPEPLEELHLSHNRLTAEGAVALLTAAAVARPSVNSGNAPTWLRLENNCIDWDAVTQQLEEKQVRWGASDSRQAWRGQRKDGKVAQVLVHRSYRHQQVSSAGSSAADSTAGSSYAEVSVAAGATGADSGAPPAQSAGGKAGSAAITVSAQQQLQQQQLQQQQQQSRTARAAAREAVAEDKGSRGKGSGRGKGSDLQYERDRLLFVRQVLLATASSRARTPKSRLRCMHLPASEDTELNAESEAAASEASPEKTRNAPDSSAPEQSPTKPQTLSLEHYLGDILGSPLPSASPAMSASALAPDWMSWGGAFPAAAHSWNAKAVEFVPSSPAPTAGEGSPAAGTPPPAGSPPLVAATPPPMPTWPLALVAAIEEGGETPAVPPLPQLNAAAAEFTPFVAAAGTAAAIAEGPEQSPEEVAAAMAASQALAAEQAAAAQMAAIQAVAAQAAAQVVAAQMAAAHVAAMQTMLQSMDSGSLLDGDLSAQMYGEGDAADAEQCHLLLRQQLQLQGGQIEQHEQQDAEQCQLLLQQQLQQGGPIEHHGQQEQLDQQAPPSPALVEEAQPKTGPALNPWAAEFRPAGPPGLTLEPARNISVAASLEPAAADPDVKDGVAATSDVAKPSRTVAAGSESTSAGEGEDDVEGSEETCTTAAQDAGCNNM